MGPFSLAASAARDRIWSRAQLIHVTSRPGFGSWLIGRQHPGKMKGECVISYAVDFNDVSTVGLESSPVTAALAGLRAHEARYFKNKCDHVFTVKSATPRRRSIGCTGFSSKNATSSFPLGRSRLRPSPSREHPNRLRLLRERSIDQRDVHPVDDPKKRAVGFKLSEGMEVPAELASRFKFARQRSKLAGTIRGSYFAFHNDY
jgi:hypothetical protein